MRVHHTSRLEVWLYDDTGEVLQDLADQLGMHRGTFVRDLILSALQDLHASGFKGVPPRGGTHRPYRRVLDELRNSKKLRRVA